MNLINIQKQYQIKNRRTKPSNNKYKDMSDNLMIY